MEDNKLNINWYPGHMAKTKKEIENDLKLIDVVIELLDARIPLSSRNPDIKKLIQNKKKIILLNKSDLADVEINNKWVAELSKEAPTLLTECSTGKGVDKVSKKIEEVMKEEIEKQKARGRINKTIRVMILGIPNVGKSTFINKIAKKNKLEVGNKPGVTKTKQWIRIGNNQELLDTPGVLWPKFQTNEIALNLAFTGTIKDDILERTEIAQELLKVLKIKYRKELLERFKITDEEFSNIEEKGNSTYELMKLIGKKRGAIVSGGEVDDEKISRIILEEFRSRKNRKDKFRRTKIGRSMDIFERNKKIEEVKLLSPLVWAYVGDGVYDLYVRVHLINKSNAKPHKLHIEATKYVKAKAQADMLQKIQDRLTEEEKDIARRGRNVENHHVAKNATVADYSQSTGFEALIGYLYLTKQDERLEEILNYCIE